MHRLGGILVLSITVSRGVVATVSDVDADLQKYKWSYGTDGYPTKAIQGQHGKVEYMHRIVLERVLQREIGHGMVAHHIDGDVMNNQRSNLDEITHAENMRYKRWGDKRITHRVLPARKARSGVKGIYPVARGGWNAQVTYLGVTYSTRAFGTIEEALDAQEQLRFSLENGTHKGRKLRGKMKNERRQGEPIPEEIRQQQWEKTAARRESLEKRRQSYRRYDESLQQYITIIFLSDGQEAIVDAVDADLAEYSWFPIAGYAKREEYGKRPRNYITMHRTILERKIGRAVGRGMVVDHINHNELDNRRSNLREATHEQNMQNRRKLPPSEIEEIRAQYTGRRGEKLVLTRKYGITYPTLNKVLNGAIKRY